MGAVQAATPSHFQAVLSRAADLLTQARSVEELAWAISDNLAVWLSLSAAAATPGCIPAEVAVSATTRARHIIETTLGSGRLAPPDQAIEEFIRLNHQMANALAASRRTHRPPPL